MNTLGIHNVSDRTSPPRLLMAPDAHGRWLRLAIPGLTLTLLFALLAGDMVTGFLAHAFSPTLVDLVRWSATILFLAMGSALLIALWLIIRRSHTLLHVTAQKLEQQQAALERARVTEALLPIGVAMNESLDLDRVLEVICRTSHDLFQVDTTLWWFKQGDELIVRAAYGSDRAAFLNMRQPVLNNDLLGARVVREERPLYVNHAMTSGGVSAEIVRRFGIRSLMGVPLMTDHTVRGALVLIDSGNDERFGALDVQVARLFAQQAEQALTHAQLYDKIQQQTEALRTALDELRANYNQTLAALSAALDARDHETEGHSRRVAAYALRLADLLEIDDSSARAAIEWGALLHDVGKIGVPDAILHKRTTLTEAEWQVMRRHPEIGYEILQSIPFLCPAFAIVRHHHERWDGSGYPLQLRGDDIPLSARIFAVADALDAMTTRRPYREPQSFDAALQEISRMRGSQFDPRVVDAFFQLSLDRWQAVGQTNLG